jgi:hypothetical protein
MPSTEQPAPCGSHRAQHLRHRIARLTAIRLRIYWPDSAVGVCSPVYEAAVMTDKRGHAPRCFTRSSVWSVRPRVLCPLAVLKRAAAAGAEPPRSPRRDARPPRRPVPHLHLTYRPLEVDPQPAISRGQRGRTKRGAALAAACRVSGQRGHVERPAVAQHVPKGAALAGSSRKNAWSRPSA